MKTIIASALLATTAFAGSAQAMVSASNIETGVRTVAPQADLAGTTEEQRTRILSILLNGDSDSEKRSSIKAILN